MLADGEREKVVVTLLRDMLNIPQAMIDRISATPNWASQVEAAHTIPRELRQSHCYAPDLTALEQISSSDHISSGKRQPVLL